MIEFHQHGPFPLDVTRQKAAFNAPSDEILPAVQYVNRREGSCRGALRT